MIIGGGRHRVEIRVVEREPPESPISGARLSVVVHCGSFHGENDSVWVADWQWEEFVQAVAELERSRTGEAGLQSTSEEFVLRISVRNRRGHLVVKGRIAEPTHLKRDDSWDIAVAFAFELDPSMLRQVLEDARALTAEGPSAQG